MDNLQPNVNPELMRNQEAAGKIGRQEKPKIHGIINPGVERIHNLAPGAIGKNVNRANTQGVNKKVVNKPPLKIQMEKGLGKVRDEFGAEVAVKTLDILKTHRRMEKPQMMTTENFSAYLAKRKYEPPSWLASLGPEEPIAIVWRGCEMESLIKMIVNESASQDEKYDLNTPRPSEEEAIVQVGEGVGEEHLPEFTRLPQIANQFGRGNVVAAFAVPVKYLTPGSGSEGGLVSARSAPTSLIGWEEGKPLDNIDVGVRNKMKY